METCLTHFLLGAINWVFHPGCKYEEMLCLVGGQGAGKSTFFRLLAIQDEWFSDDLKQLSDNDVFEKLQGHWIIEMSEMLATSNAKSIEEIRSFISRQKETYRTRYESQPKDRLRQCVFGGTSNTVDFLPLDRAGNRRFLPVMTDPNEAEVHILDNEAESRAYLLQVWAEAMEIYRRGDYSMKFSVQMQKELKLVQQNFMQEDTDAGIILDFLERYKGDRYAASCCTGKPCGFMTSRRNGSSMTSARSCVPMPKAGAILKIPGHSGANMAGRKAGNESLTTNCPATRMDFRR